MIWKALILAGSRGQQDPVAQAASVSHKAFAEIAGETMIAHVAKALREVPDIGEIAVSIEKDAPPLPDGFVRLDAGASPAASLLEALEVIGTPLFVTTADNPLLTGQTVTAFLTKVNETGADVAAGLARREVVEKADNPARRTYLKFKDCQASGCNLFAFTSADARKVAEFWRELETERKRPWRMARKLGLSTLLKYVCGLLGSKQAAHAIGRRAGCEAFLVFIDDPFAAHDVDKPGDLVFARKVLEKRLSGKER